MRASTHLGSEDIACRYHSKELLWVPIHRLNQFLISRFILRPQDAAHFASRYGPAESRGMRKRQFDLWDVFAPPRHCV